MLPYSSSEKPAAPTVSYQSTEPAQPPRSGGNLAWIIGTLLGLIAIGGAIFAVYYIYFRKPLPSIAIQVSTLPEKALLGEPFKISVAYTNASDQVLQDASVAVTVPDGVAIIGTDPSTRLVQ